MALALTAVRAQGAPLSCDIEAKSREGGRIQVATWDYGPDSLAFKKDHPAIKMMPPPATISWHPPSSNDSVDLVFFYGDGDLQKLGAMTDAAIIFAPFEVAEPEQYTTTVTSDGAQTWHFAKATSEIMTGQMEVTLADAAPNAFTNARSDEDKVSALALSQTKHLTITVANGRSSEMTTRFDTSAIAGRDQLIAYARHLVETRDARVCRERD